MRFRITLLCIFLSLLITSSVYAQKVYYWKDKNGVENISTTPPPDNIKTYKKDSWGPKATKQEIEQYQRQEKQKARKAQEQVDLRTNEARETSERDRQQTEKETRDIWNNFNRHLRNLP